MISDALQKWPIVIFVTLAMANPQFPMPYPMPGYPPMFPVLPPMSPLPPPVAAMPPPPAPAMQMPMPMHIPMSIGIALVPDTEAEQRERDRTSTTTTTTTTTTKKPDFDINDFAIAVPMPLPYPVPGQNPMPGPMPMPGLMPSPVLFAVPGTLPSVCKNNSKHPRCPPCPPCTCFPCTPAFFSYCSPCHLKCRCRNGENAPIPLPPKAPAPLPGYAYPMPYPMHNDPNLMVIPFPQQKKQTSRRKKKHRQSKFRMTYHKRHDEPSNSKDDQYVEADSRERFQHDQKYDMYRRSFEQLDIDRSDDMLVKPILTYVASDGAVKIRKSLRKIDAANLLNDDANNLVRSKDRREMVNDFDNRNNNFNERPSRRGHKRLKHGQANFGTGKKRLIFRPPANMLVGNLSVSFNT